jgi:hypothetical protein
MPDELDEEEDPEDGDPEEGKLEIVLVDAEDGEDPEVDDNIEVEMEGDVEDD